MKSCSDCRHNKICFLYREAVVIHEKWNETYEVPLPLMPSQLAIECPHFESPVDIITISKTTKQNTQELGV